MKTGTLAIYDVDGNYANCLMEYISDKQGIPFETMAFTNKAALQEYTAQQHIDILLISAGSMEEDISHLDIGKIVILSEGELSAEYIEYSSIFKFQSTENIIREVINYYVDVSSEKVMLSMAALDAEIIGVYSPIGRSGKTTFALTLGQILSNDKATLYINMEEFSAFEKIFQKSYTGDLADLMYFYRQNPHSLPIKIKAIVNNLHGLDYIPPLVFSGDLRNIESSMWIGMIRAIADSGIYQTIILDVSNMVRDVFNIMEMCNTIYMPINNDKVSLLKIAEYEEFMLKTDREELINNTVKIKIPITEENQWGENYLEQQLWGELGDFIRKILREAVV